MNILAALEIELTIFLYVYVKPLDADRLAGRNSKPKGGFCCHISAGPSVLVLAKIQAKNISILKFETISINRRLTISAGQRTNLEGVHSESQHSWKGSVNEEPLSPAHSFLLNLDNTLFGRGRLRRGGSELEA